MIRFYTSVIVFFMLLPGSGISAGLKSTSNQKLQHHRVATLADCVAEVAPETDLLSFQKKYRHTAEQKCREMLAAKRRKTAVVTPVDNPDSNAENTNNTDDATNTDVSGAAGTENAAPAPKTQPTPQPQNYWRNDAAD